MLDNDLWREMSSNQLGSVTVSVQHLWMCANTGTAVRISVCVLLLMGAGSEFWPMQRTGVTPDHCAPGKILQCSLYFSWGFWAGPKCHEMLCRYLADMYQRRNIKRSSQLKKQQMLSANFSTNFRCNFIADVCLMMFKNERKCTYTHLQSFFLGVQKK